MPKEQHATRGISILVKKELKNKITDWDAINENIIRVNMNILQHKLTVFGAYGVSSDATVSDKDSFFETLNQEILKVGDKRELIILGDLNSRTGKMRSNNIVGPFGEENGYRV